jgi:hypothetical protein
MNTLFIKECVLDRLRIRVRLRLKVLAWFQVILAFSGIVLQFI